MFVMMPAVAAKATDIWPEKAEHYVLSHNVWTPDCDALLVAVRTGK